jgi:Rod binding domain-containing protein
VDGSAVSLKGGAAAATAGQDLLLAGAKSGAGSRDDAKIQKAGHDFETLLLSSWLGAAEHSFAQAPGGADESEDEDGSADQFLSMGTQQLASTLADHGGIGIAKMIVDSLRKSGTKGEEKNPKMP